MCSVNIQHQYRGVFLHLYSDVPDSWWFLQILASVLHGNVQFPLTLIYKSVVRI